MDLGQALSNIREQDRYKAQSLSSPSGLLFSKNCGKEEVSMSIKRKLFVVLMSIIMVFTMMPMVSGVYAADYLYSVTLPSAEDQANGNYTISKDIGSLDGNVYSYGGTYSGSFTVTIDSGYLKSENFAVKADGVTLSGMENNGGYSIKYDLSASHNGATITVEGVVKKLIASSDSLNYSEYAVSVNNGLPKITYGGDVDVVVSIKAGYQAGGDFAVYYKGQLLETPEPVDKKYTYTLQNVTEDVYHWEFKPVDILEEGDDRTPIKEFELVSQDPFFAPFTTANDDLYCTTIPTGTPSTSHATKGRPIKFYGMHWCKWDEVDEYWREMDSGKIFTEGRYRVEGSLRLDELTTLGEITANTHYISDLCTAKINNVKWETSGQTTMWNNYGYKISQLDIWSGELTITRPNIPIGFTDGIDLGYKNSYMAVGYAMEPVDVGGKAFGGQGDYTFSKVSGPGWMEVSPEGVISGTPTAASDASKLVVRVTDTAQEPGHADVEIDVPKVYDLSNRIQIHKIYVNSDQIDLPWCQKTVSQSTFYDNSLLVDENGNRTQPVAWSINDGWYTVGDYAYQMYNNDDFYVGEQYRIKATMYVDDFGSITVGGKTFDGKTHVLADDVKLVVNGEEWTRVSTEATKEFDGINGPYSYFEFSSPVYTSKHWIGEATSETVIKKATMTEDGIVERNGICGGCFESFTEQVQVPKASSFKLSTTSYTYNGSAKTPTVTVKDADGKPLFKDTDYTVSYSNNKNIGTATATVTGKGNYSFTKKLTFTIKAKDLASTSKVYVSLCGYDDVKVSWNSVSGAGGYYVYYKRSTSSSYTYAGKTTSTSYKLYNFTDGASYTFRVYPCVKDGTGKYYKDGSYRTSSSIYTLKKVTSVKAVRSGTKVKVSWSNISGESGYQISRSTKKTGTNIVKTYSTTSGKYYSVSATKGKTYYYKVRAYKTVNGTRIYAPWSTVYKYKR